MPGDTRQSLIDSARGLLRERGLSAVTLRAVGEQSGVSRTTPYRHFKDKTDLLGSVAATVLAELVEDLDARVLAAGQGKAGRMRAFLEAYVRFALEHPAEYQLVYAPVLVTAGHPDVAAAADKAVELMTDRLFLSGNGDRAKIDAVAVIAVAHGIAELALSGHFARKQVEVSDIVAAVSDRWADKR